MRSRASSVHRVAGRLGVPRCGLVRGGAAGIAAVVATLSVGACAIDFDRHFASEDCFNATDDDGDGAVDCADEACGAAACVAHAPEGWLGPVILVQGGAASCPEPLSSFEVGMLCASCRCDGSVSCAAPAVQVFAGSCDPPAEVELDVGSGDCVEVNVSGGVASALGTEPVASGQCAPSGGGVGAAALCESPQGGGCEDEDRCMPADLGEVCIHRIGDWPCPDGYPIVNHFAADEDAMSCSECSCAAGSDACAASTSLFTARACTGESVVVPHDDATCMPLPDAPRSLRYSPPAGEGCEASGGLPDASSFRTVCCAG